MTIWVSYLGNYEATVKHINTVHKAAEADARNSISHLYYQILIINFSVPETKLSTWCVPRIFTMKKNGKVCFFQPSVRAFQQTPDSFMVNTSTHNET